jgi:hypothetical protein
MVGIHRMAINIVHNFIKIPEIFVGKV